MILSGLLGSGEGYICLVILMIRLGIIVGGVISLCVWVVCSVVVVVVLICVMLLGSII